MAESGFNWAGAAQGAYAGGYSPDAAMMFKSPRKLQKKELKQQKRILQHSYQNVLDEQKFRETEDPREQAALTQSLFGRGLGKSTIAQQDRERLTGIQGRRAAALARSAEIHRQGLSLFKKRQKMLKRTKYLRMAYGLYGAALGGLSQSSGGSGVTAAQGGAAATGGAAGGVAGAGGSIGAGVSGS